MAGDWIKMRGNLWDDPRVGRLVDLTDTSEAAVIGGLYWLWATADQHTEDGVMPGLSLRQIDRKTGVKGMGDALVAVGWLAEHLDGVRIINFEDHNGASAKKRLETARRVAKHRNTPQHESAANEESEDGDYKRLAIPKRLRDAVIARDGGCCVYCGKEGGALGAMDTRADGYIHLDHVIPLARGGSNDETNLVASCRKCNMKKGDRTPDEAGMEWPVVDGKRIGNAVALHKARKGVTKTLAERDLEKRREEKSISEEEDYLYPATEIPEPSQAAMVCLAMKAVGIADTSPGNPKLRALLDAGATVEEFVDAGRKAVGSQSGFRYALAVVENGRKAAAAMANQIHQGAMPAIETAYQRSMRERMAEAAPEFARKAPGQSAENATEFFNAIDVTARPVELLK